MREEKIMFITFIGVFLGILAIIAISMAVLPPYFVWSAGLKGKAELRRAEQNKQVLIEQARAEYESAKFKADAEIERAKGVAEANQIIGESLKNNEMYLRYLWVQGLQEGGNAVIYVPTEANLPILEAGRLSQ
jgi:regulator of protease activity HflC (stomatin/prohibitin superfamily)